MPLSEKPSYACRPMGTGVITIRWIDAITAGILMLAMAFIQSSVHAAVPAGQEEASAFRLAEAVREKALGAADGAADLSSIAAPSLSRPAVASVFWHSVDQYALPVGSLAETAFLRPAPARETAGAPSFGSEWLLAVLAHKTGP